MNQNKKNILTAGFALFSMFFGSGNLVFPLYVGREACSSYPYAILGLFLTAIIIPVIGFLGVTLNDGNREKYFSNIGSTGTFLLTALMLSLMGPFGVIPRCIGVAFGGITLIFPTLSLSVFSAIFCVALFALIWSSENVVSIIGKILTPLKLGGIIILIMAGIFFAPQTTHCLTNSTSTESFNLGITQGYQTMDLLAGFFFGCSIVEFLRKNATTQSSTKDIFKSSICAGILGSILLAIVYTGFILLGAYYAPLIQNVPAETILAHISGIALGKESIPFVGFTLAVSCLATATILTKLFADFLSTEILKNKLSYRQSALITLIISFIGSLFGFQQIVCWIAWFLSWLYPLLLLYAVYKVYEGIILLNQKK